LRLVHEGDELGVEVAEQGHAERGEDAGIHLAGAGTEEDAEGRREWCGHGWGPEASARRAT
jgi:hypothetical protein